MFVIGKEVVITGNNREAKSYYLNRNGVIIDIVDNFKKQLGEVWYRVGFENHETALFSSSCFSQFVLRFYDLSFSEEEDFITEVNNSKIIKQYSSNNKNSIKATLKNKKGVYNNHFYVIKDMFNNSIVQYGYTYEL